MLVFLITYYYLQLLTITYHNTKLYGIRLTDSVISYSFRGFGKICLTHSGLGRLRHSVSKPQNFQA